MSTSFVSDLDNNLLVAARNYDVHSILNLQKSHGYIDIMQKVEDAIIDKPKLVGIVDEEQLILDCHALSVEIENEIVLIHNFIREKYGLKVAELESFVNHPIDYACAVKNMDLTTSFVGLRMLPSPIIIVFSSWLLGKATEASDTAIALHSAKQKLLDCVESRIPYVAPNLSAVVGCGVAAKLMNTAGGLSSLAKMHTSSVLILGAKRKNLEKFRRVGGYIEQSEIIQTTIPPRLRKRACIMLAAKSILAARLDSTRGYPPGEYGTSLREDMIKKLQHQ